VGRSQLHSERSIHADGALHYTAPWLHYIPLKLDYSDLYDIMAFFVGPIGPDGQVDASKGHDVRASNGSPRRAISDH
jgi:hypothetical protein